MRALVCKEYGPVEKLVIETMDDPTPGSGEVLVEVRAAGLNFPDVLAIAGMYQVKTPPPFVPGNEAAGVVAAVGDGVARFKEGDPVMFTSTGGAFAEKCVVKETMLAPMIPGLSFEQAGGFPITYSTSYHAFRQSAPLAGGETVLVLGAAGGVGITAVEIAKAMGARVIAAASSDEKLAFAREAGADDAINYSEQPLKETAKELTGGKGVDVVYDPVGGELAEQALRAAAWHGRFLVVGFACGDIPKLPANLALLKEASITGVFWGAWAARNPQLQVQNTMEMGQLIADGKIAPRVTESFALDDYVKAFRTITERRVKGKLVFTM
ncbi:MAG: NADPH:quinone oxidoreductase family protein [Gammaproteobacteria bacterium]|nr:NADPH:quinone oxidoreductase family protein [Gammaproteobacteria bacterium]